VTAFKGVVYEAYDGWTWTTEDPEGEQTGQALRDDGSPQLWRYRTDATADLVQREAPSIVEEQDGTGLYPVSREAEAEALAAPAQAGEQAEQEQALNLSDTARRAVAAGFSEDEVVCWVAVARAAEMFFGLSEDEPVEHAEIGAAFYAIQRSLLARPARRAYVTAEVSSSGGSPSESTNGEPGSEALPDSASSSGGAESEPSD
jgi:hypothetical protein